MANQPSELEMARLALARTPRDGDDELARALLQVLRVVADALEVERVGIWEINAGWSRIECRALYERTPKRFSSGLVLQLSEFPAYALALKERRVIAAEDAHTDPRTLELEESYLRVHDIGAILDCPVYDKGSVIAILCHEHVGSSRKWHARNSDFAVNASDIVSTLYAHSARVRYETELRQAREALAEARVMDSLGRMAARVAHDFNNTLMGISLSLSAIEHEVELNASSRTALDDCRNLVDQGSRLVRSLVSFARTGDTDGRHVDLCSATSDMLPRLQRLVGVDITLHADIPNESGLVALDLARAEQILMNLVLNARDALIGGGAIHLAIELSNEIVQLTISDNGVGMDPETRQRIFEPFFTTKGERGSGLGLAIVFGAVRGAGGSVDVDSELGGGACFKLRFPRLST